MAAIESLLSEFLFTILVYIIFRATPLSDPKNYTTPQCSVFSAAQTHYDFIIIGGGTAGSVLANTLSHNPNFKVLLIEAGMPPNNYSEVPLTNKHMKNPVSAHDWQFQTQPGNYCQAYPTGCTIHQGRGVGGSSIINDMLSYEGNSNEYDKWNTTNWSWAAVYSALGEEISMMQPTLPNSTYDEDPTKAGILQAYGNLSRPNIFQTGDRMGYHEIPVFVNHHRRTNAAKAYITPIVNQTNLCILNNVRVTRILIDPASKDAVGVEVITQIGMKLNITIAQEIILAAGAINSPKLLMLSGVGPEDHLIEKGIPIIVPLEGVGKNLQDQIEFPLHYALGANEMGNISMDLIAATGPFVTNSSGVLGDLKFNNFVGYINTDWEPHHNSSQHSTPQDFFPNAAITRLLFANNDTILLPIMLNSLGYNSLTELFITAQNLYQGMMILQPTLLRPESRGYLLLNTTNIDDQPLIYPNYLDPTTTDFDKLNATVEHVFNLVKANKNLNISRLDMPSPNCLPLYSNAAAYFNCNLLALARPVGNVVGTCRMGPNLLAGDVVDDRLRVYGVGNLRVVDASIVPQATGADLVTMELLIAELASNYILIDTYFG